MTESFLRLGERARLGDYAAFTDESSISAHRYMMVGGVSCRSDHAQAVHDAVCAIRRDARFPNDSLQWKTINAKKLADYRRLVDYFLEENDRHRLDFSCIVIDTRKLNHRAHGDGNGETTFQKFMFQITECVARKYAADRVRLYHGKRDSPWSLSEVRGIINAGIAKKRRRMNYHPLLTLEYKSVPDSGPHQIADVLLGAVSHHWNAYKRRGDGPKHDLAQYIRSECCAHRLDAATPWWQPHLDIWEFRLRED